MWKHLQKCKPKIIFLVHFHFYLWACNVVFDGMVYYYCNLLWKVKGVWLWVHGNISTSSSELELAVHWACIGCGSDHTGIRSAWPPGGDHVWPVHSGLGSFNLGFLICWVVLGWPEVESWVGQTMIQHCLLKLGWSRLADHVPPWPKSGVDPSPWPPLVWSPI